jgi:hypothetical protein
MSLRGLLLKLDPSQLVDDVSQLGGILVGVGDGACKNDRKVNGQRARRGRSGAGDLLINCCHPFGSTIPWS